MRCFAALLAIGMTAAAWASEPPDDQQLIERAPRQHAPPAPGQVPAAAPAPSANTSDDLDQAEQVARVEANLAQARLEMVLARKALRAGDLAASAQRAEKVTLLLRDIPPDVDVSESQLQAEGILARAARAGVKLGAAPTPAPPPQPDFAQQGRLRERYQADAARALTEADEGRLIPNGVVTYPRDWPERIAKRKKWADGVIARSPSTFDQDGREWYAAIYDIRDVTYVPPDFVDERVMAHSYVLLRDALDRQALRDGSMIFRGTAADLAAGIPLLRFFGGVNPWLVRGPKYSPQREREVIEMIRGFTGVQVNEAPPP